MSIFSHVYVKRRVRNCGALMCAMMMVLVSWSASSQTLKMATISPDGLAWMKQLRAAMKVVEQNTDGRVKFKLYPGGVQGDDFTVLRKMRIGQLQGGALAAGTLIRYYTDLQIYNLPLQFQNFGEVDAVRARMDQGIVDGIGSGGMHIFPLVETGFAYLLTKKPVTNPADLAQLKVWVPEGDPLGEQLVKLFKVSPVPLNITDVLAALQTGLVDAVAVPPLVAIALQWHNHIDYMMDLPLMYIYSVLAIDGRAMKKISPADQAAMAAVIDPLMQEIDALNRIDNLKAFDAILNTGVERVTPTAADLIAWEAVAVDAVTAMVEAGEVTQPVLDEFDAVLTEHRERRP